MTQIPVTTSGEGIVAPSEIPSDISDDTIIYNHTMKKWIYPLAFVPPVIFPFAALLIGFRNYSIFDAPHLLRASPFPVIVFLLGVFFAAALSLRSGTLKNNLPGLALFLLFTVGYFLLASVFNKPEINTNNMYFAADTASWYQRMAAEDGWQVGTRAVHPLAYILFRPMVMVLSFFTSGDRFYANLILLALAGGGCVVLMWRIVLDLVDDAVHASSPGFTLWPVCVPAGICEHHRELYIFDILPSGSRPANCEK